MTQREKIARKIEALAARGEKKYPDFREKVMDTALKGKWRLTMTTCFAIFRCKNDFEIIRYLSKHRKIADKVGELDDAEQIKYVRNLDWLFNRGLM